MKDFSQIWRLEVQCQATAWWACDECPLSGLQMGAFFLCLQMTDRSSCSLYSYKDANPTS
jgi:hypothetical protein